MIEDEILVRWYQGEAVEGARYTLNTAIRFLNGEMKGQFGSLISLESLSPAVIYLVEASDGCAKIVKESEIEAVT